MAIKNRRSRASSGKADPHWRSKRAVDWIEKYCRVPEGKFVGKPLKVAPFMVEDFQAIYDNPHGTRRAIISRGRKNAKTVEAALIMLLHLCGPESKPNSEINSAAQSRDQAAILFDRAAKMIRMSQELNSALKIIDSSKIISFPERGTRYRALSADAPTAFGLSPAVLIHDELGVVKGPRSPLYEALETATAAQEEPLSIVISTQAPTDDDLLSRLIDDAKGGYDPRVVLRINSAPEDIDPFSEEAIRAANPALDVFMNKAEVLAMAADASRMSCREAEFRNLILNQRVEASSPFVSRQIWQACGDEPAPLDDVPVYGGLDLSEVRDLTALVLIGNVEGKWQVHPTFWLPADGLEDKARKDRVPYDVWRNDGFLKTAPGKSVDYEFVAEFMRDVFDKYQVEKIAFDRWNFRHLRPWLLKAGFDEDDIEAKFQEFGQGTQSMSPALRALEGDIANGRLAHGNHPVLAMCAANAVVDGKDSSNRKLSKSKSSGRIDGMVALTMARGIAGEDFQTGTSSIFDRGELWA